MVITKDAHSRYSSWEMRGIRPRAYGGRERQRPEGHGREEGAVSPPDRFGQGTALMSARRLGLPPGAHGPPSAAGAHRGCVDQVTKPILRRACRMSTRRHVPHHETHAGWNNVQSQLRRWCRSDSRKRCAGGSPPLPTGRGACRADGVPADVPMRLVPIIAVVPVRRGVETRGWLAVGRRQ
jgi:hypothetical protein